MNPLSKMMAETSLGSDDSTASLSEASMDGEIFEDSQSLSSVPFLNPKAASFKPRNRKSDPIGKQMAEALLASDESTAALSESSMDGHIFEEPPSVSSVSFNPTVRPLKSRNREGGPRDGGVIAPPPGFSKPLGARIFSSGLAYPQTKGLVSRHLALDCEMVGVGPGGKKSVLARVSLVDYFGRCLFDTFVRVEERVTDYRHHITGISESDLSSKSAMKFGECRLKVINVIRNKILVGHGLENDLAVLGIKHPWCNIRDTCSYYLYQKKDRFGRPCPSRLCHLTKIHLGIEIQKKNQPHCPIEDACAAMALYRKHQAGWDSLLDCQLRNGIHQY